MLIIDCVKSPPVSAMQAAGVGVVIRYLAFNQLNTLFKRLSTAELATLRAANLEVMPNWEQGAQDWMLGAQAGTSQGQEAARQLAVFGFPLGTPCPASNDMDMTRGQWLANGRSFAIAYDNALTAAGYRPGVYGSTDVLDWYRTEINPDAFLWQAMSTAWAEGRNAQINPHTHLYQSSTGTIGGVEVDFNAMINEWRTAPERRAMLISIELPDGSNVDGFVDGFGGWHHITSINALAAAERAAGVNLPVQVSLADAREAFNLGAMDDHGVMPAPPAAATGTVHVTGDLTVS